MVTLLFMVFSVTYHLELHIVVIVYYPLQCKDGSVL